MSIIPFEGAPPFHCWIVGSFRGILMEGLGKLGWCEDTWGLGRKAVYQWARAYLSILAILVSYICVLV